MSRFARILSACALTPLCVMAQAPEVSAPFVSRLRAQTRGSGIVLTWKDSPDARGPLSVYRHVEEITAETFAKAHKVGQVAYGTGSFTDHPSDARPYFYAVIASDPQGRPYEVLVAFRNKTLSPCAVEEIGSPEEVGARVTALRAEPVADRIRLTFAVDRPGRTLVLYRSTSPIARLADLLGAVAAIVEPGRTSYEDTPPPGIPFYYAAADEELSKTGKARFVPGENATAEPATVAPAPGAGAPVEAARAVARARPLPFLAIERAVHTGEGIRRAQNVPPRRPLGARGEEAVAALLASLAAHRSSAPAPVVLDIDRAETGGGEESILKSIIDEALKSGDAVAAEHRLRGFLSVRRSADLEGRARFYLGEALYFQRRTSEALKELLVALDAYYADVRPWVDRCLDELAGIR